MLPLSIARGQMAGEAFDLTNVQDGLFEGYLVERASYYPRSHPKVMKHILTVIRLR